jgi:hypothetical protein
VLVKANARVKPAKMGHGPHSSKLFVLFYVSFVLCRSVYCLCVNVYCTTATATATQLQLTNTAYQTCAVDGILDQVSDCQFYRKNSATCR